MPTWTIVIPDFDGLIWSDSHDGRRRVAVLGSSLTIKASRSSESQTFYAEVLIEKDLRTLSHRLITVSEQGGFDSLEEAARWAYDSAIRYVNAVIHALR